MFSMSEKQKQALASVANGPGAMPIIHFSKLREAGYVVSSGDGSGQRGYVGAKITDAGRVALLG